MCPNTQASNRATSMSLFTGNTGTPLSIGALSFDDGETWPQLSPIVVGIRIYNCKGPSPRIQDVYGL